MYFVCAEVVSEAVGLKTLVFIHTSCYHCPISIGLAGFVKSVIIWSTKQSTLLTAYPMPFNVIVNLCQDFDNIKGRPICLRTCLKLTMQSLSQFIWQSIYSCGSSILWWF